MKDAHSELLIELLRRGLQHETSSVYLKHRWGEETGSKRLHITQAEGDLLTEEGYLTPTNGQREWVLTPKGLRYAMPHVEYTPHKVSDILNETLSRKLFHPLPEDHETYPGETPIPFIYQPGSSKLVLVLGENAGGKSLFRRILQAITHRGRKAQHGRSAVPAGPYPVNEYIHLSMQGRTESGIMSAMIYGTEEWQSTGEISARSVDTGIETSSGRSHPNIIYWDEPDLGMSASTAAGAGQALAGFVGDDHPLVQMVCVTSHSPALVQQLRGLDPHYIYLGNDEGPATLNAWFDYQVNPPPITPTQVADNSLRRFRIIGTLQKK